MCRFFLCVCVCVCVCVCECLRARALSSMHKILRVDTLLFIIIIIMK